MKSLPLYFAILILAISTAAFAQDTEASFDTEPQIIIDMPGITRPATSPDETGENGTDPSLEEVALYDNQVQETYPGGFFVDMGGGNDPDVFGAKIGGFGYLQSRVCLHAGLAMLASEKFDDVFVGGDGGLRIHTFKPDDPVSPFIGMGFFGGYTKKTVSAEDDEEDNDDDGLVDEAGEEKQVIDNVLGSFYPEIGLRIKLTHTAHLVLSGRYNLTTEGRTFDYWLYTLGLEFRFDEGSP